MQYLSAEHQKALSGSYRLAVILAISFFVAMAVIMLVGRTLRPGEAMAGSEKWGQPVYAAVIVMGVAIVVLRRILMSRMVMGQTARVGVRTTLDNLIKVMIICLAIAEIVGITGLTFYLITGDYQYSWRLGVVGLLLILYSFPRRGEWERAVTASSKGEVS